MPSTKYNSYNDVNSEPYFEDGEAKVKLELWQELCEWVIMWLA